jgi:hypothetical protein
MMTVQSKRHSFDRRSSTSGSTTSSYFDILSGPLDRSDRQIGYL